MNRILCIVDVSNLYYTVKRKYNDKINYTALLEYCQYHGYVYRAVCYASDMDGKAEEFFKCLKATGYEVKVKETRSYENKGAFKQKANCDIDMVVDIIRYQQHYDELILVCSDGDMVPVVKYCQERGVKVHILACGINNDLRQACDSWFEIGPSFLENIKDESPEAAE